MVPVGTIRFPAALDLGRRIRERRIELGLSQEMLSFAADLHRTYIGGVERGERNPGIWNVLKIARALEIDPADLVEGLRP
jgi:transcriptional regulator with XRE-family HTH domain